MLNHTNAFLQTVAGAVKESIEGFCESRVGSATLRVWGRLQVRETEQGAEQRKEQRKRERRRNSPLSRKPHVALDPGNLGS